MRRSRRPLPALRPRHRAARSRRTQLEQLELRHLLATYVVTSTLDAGPGTLRQAILDANGQTGADTIEFDIAGLPDEGSANFVIRPLTPLPPLADPSGGTSIAGQTQTTSRGDLNPFGPEITLDGGLLSSGDGLVLDADNNGVSGLNIRSFPGAGLRVISGTGNLLDGNTIGVDDQGSAERGNGLSGIAIDGGTQTLVGSPLAPNLIAYNLQDGVRITGSSTTASVRYNTIFGNTGLPVDLGGDGITETDEGDFDTGPNSLVNRPVITSVTESSRFGTTLTTITGFVSTGDLETPTTVDIYRAETSQNAYLGTALAFGNPLDGSKTFSFTFASFGGGQGGGRGVATDAPNPPPGDRFTAVVVGDDGATSEYADSVAIPADFPDLVIADLQIDPTTPPGPNQLVRIQWTERNNGLVPADGMWFDTIALLNPTTQQTVAFQQFSNFQLSGPASSSLAPGAAVQRTVDMLWPSGQAGAGDLLLQVHVDAFNWIQEGGQDGNNLASLAFNLPLPPSPDLIVTDLEIDPAQPLTSGQATLLRWNERNIGDADAPAGWSDSIRILRASDQVELYSSFLDTSTMPGGTDPLAPSGVRAREVLFTVPSWVDLSGEVLVKVSVDAWGSVGEGNATFTAEANNDATITVSPAAIDLVVANLRIDPRTIARAGVPLTILWDNHNTGSASAQNNWFDRVLITKPSTGEVLYDNQIVFDTAVSGPLIAGGSANRSVTLTLPVAPLGAGDFLITVTTDRTNFVAESNSSGTGEINNSSQIPVTAEFGFYPDFTVSNVRLVNHGNVYPGDVITVEWDESNIGQAAFTSFWWYQVVITNPATGAVLVDQRYFSSPFTDLSAQPGGVQPRSRDITIPTGSGSVGTLNVAVTVDAPFNLAYELNATGTGEMNNSASTTVTVLDPIPPALPDLVVNNVAISPATGLVPGNMMTITWTENNQGLADAANYVTTVTITNLTTGNSLLFPEGGFFGGPSPVKFFFRNGLTVGANEQTTLPFVLPEGLDSIGNLRVNVTVDTFGNIFEGNSGGETNNDGSGLTTVLSGLLPDLTVTDLTVAPTTQLRSGDSVTVQWQDTNSGTGPASGLWSDRLEVTNLNTGSVIWTASIPYDARPSGLGALAAGSAVARSHTFDLPNGLETVGNLQFKVITDYVDFGLSQIAEYNSAGTGETNNTTSITRAVVLADYPDLQVEELSVTPSTNIHAGDLLTITWTDVNNGTAAITQPWWNRVNIFPVGGGSPVASDFVRVTPLTDFGGPFTPGGRLSHQLTLQLPANHLGTGDFRVIVDQDSAAEILEIHPDYQAESNNSAQFNFTSTLASTTDLAITGLELLPTTPLTTGQPVTLRWFDTNLGTAPVSGDYFDFVTVLVDGIIRLTQSVPITGLVGNPMVINPGESAPRELAFDLPIGTEGAGNVEFRVITNSSRVIPEVNSNGTPYENNTSSVFRTVALSSYPDLLVTDISIDPATPLQAGAPVTLRWHDRNIGTAPISGKWANFVSVSNLDLRNHVMSSPVVEFDTVASGHGPLEPGESVQREVTFTLPANHLGLGRLEFAVRVDSRNDVQEFNAAGTAETNNLTPFEAQSVAAPAADLQPLNFQHQPSAGLQSGQQITFSWTDKNTGQLPITQSWSDQLIVRNATTHQVLVTEYVDYDSASNARGPLAAGASVPRQVTLQLPNRPEAVGELRFELRADHFNSIAEFNATATGDVNNLLDLTANVAPAAMAELVIDALTLDPAGPLQSGQEVTAHWTIRNAGQLRQLSGRT